MVKSASLSKVVSITVPEGLKEILEVVPKIGYYDSLSEFIRDAVRTLLRSRSDVHTLIVYHLYKEKKISITQVGVMLGVPTSQAEQLMKEWGVK